MRSDAWGLVFTGLSLTCTTATVLFLLVAMNPKESAYGASPLIYAGVSALTALVFNRASAWASHQGLHRRHAKSTTR